MKLYGLPGACSLADHITLQWTGKPFEYEAVARDGLKKAPYTDINPLGAVPALTDGDIVLTRTSRSLSTSRKSTRKPICTAA